MAPCMHQVAPLKCVRFTSEFVSFSVRRTTWCFMCSKCFVLFGSLLFSNCWFLLKRNPRWWFEKYVTHLGEMIQMDWIHLNLGSFRFWRPKNHAVFFGTSRVHDCRDQTIGAWTFPLCSGFLGMGKLGITDSWAGFHTIHRTSSGIFTYNGMVDFVGGGTWKVNTMFFPMDLIYMGWKFPVRMFFGNKYRSV